MLKLILGDLVANLRIWLGAFAVAAATAAVGAVVGCGLATAVAVGGDYALALYAISGTILTLTAVTAVIVTGTVAGLTVTLQQRGYALWQLAGIGPGRVRAVVTTQLALVSLAGATAGCLVALPVLAPLWRPVFPDVTFRFTTAAAVPVVLAVVLVVTIGGFRSAGRAGRTPPIRSLREPEQTARRMSRGRWLAGLSTLAVTGAIVASLPGGDPERLTAPLTLVGPLTAGVLAAFSPLFLTRLLRAWTAVVPATASSAWFLARNNTAHHIARGTGAINPIMVAIALAGGMYAADATVADSAPTVSTVLLLLGGPMLLSLVGAAATIVMGSGPREREYALILAAGGTPATVLLTAAAEAVIYVVTAALLGVAAVVVTALAGAWAVSVAPSFGLPAVAAVTGAGLLLTLAATVAPTALALRHDVPRTLARDA